MCHLIVLIKVIGDAIIMSQICKMAPQLHTHTHLPPTHSDFFVIHPLSEAVTSIKLAIVSFSFGVRKELYLSADVWPTHTGTLLWSSLSKYLSKWIFLCITHCTIYVCNEELYHCLQCMSPSESHCQLAWEWETHFPAHTQCSGVLVNVVYTGLIYVHGIFMHGI